LFIVDSLAFNYVPLCDVHQANGNKLRKLDGSGAQLDYHRAEVNGLELISKAKVALMALFAISDSFALDIELQFAVARLETEHARQKR
jgi:hypothetical protein